MTIRAHAAAAVAMLEADAALTVYYGEVPSDATGRYVIVHITTPQGLSRRVSADAPKSRFLLSTIAVGDSPNECAWVVEHVHAALIRERLAVAGRICDPFLPPADPAPIREDDDVTPSVWVATDVWPFTSSAIEGAA